MTSAQQQVADYFKAAPQQSYTKGTVLLRPEQQLEHLWFIERGRVIQYHIDPNGNKLIMNVYKPGVMIPAYLAVSQVANDFFFEVDDDETVLRRVGAEAARDFLSSHPEVVFDLFSRLSIGLTGVLQRLSIHMSGTAEARLVVELLIASQRFGAANTNGQIVIQLTEQQLAAQAGIARETVSRELKKLLARDFISREGRQLHIDAPKLRDHLKSIS